MYESLELGIEDCPAGRTGPPCTLVQAATLNGLDPEAYLRDILVRIADHPINRIGDFLPWNCAAA